jgi:heparin/heparan-sulfate lyase
MLLNYAYSSDSLLKAEFDRQGGLPDNPVLFLLLNDPGLKAEKSMESLPLTMDFGPVIGSMVARTGWHIGMNSSDVVAQIKGGGYHFGNHQHSDAGSIQLYYRGFQFGDIGEYKFYGTPYDYNFNKRSIAHSMMLAVDPGEKFGNTESNDGGTRFNQRFPKTPEEAQTDP